MPGTGLGKRAGDWAQIHPPLFFWSLFLDIDQALKIFHIVEFYLFTVQSNESALSEEDCSTWSIK